MPLLLLLLQQVLLLLLLLLAARGALAEQKSAVSIGASQAARRHPRLTRDTP